MVCGGGLMRCGGGVVAGLSLQQVCVPVAPALYRRRTHLLHGALAPEELEDLHHAEPLVPPGEPLQELLRRLEPARPRIALWAYVYGS